MSPMPKINQEPTPEQTPMPDFDLAQTMAASLLKNIERLADIQKQTINLTVQQNTEFADVLKKTAGKLPIVPRLAFFDLATGSLNRIADTQKQAIDFVVEQSKVWTDLFKDRSKMAKDVSDSNSKTVKQTIESTLTVNKKTLDNAAAEAKATVDAVREQFGLGGTQVTAMSDSLKKGIDTLVDAQKEMIDLVAQ